MYSRDRINHFKNQLAILLSVALVLMLGSSWATEPHQHGAASMELVMQGKMVEIRLVAPAASVVGFEHAPSSDQDQLAVGKAMAILSETNLVFDLESVACTADSANVDLGILANGSSLAEHAEHDHDDSHEHDSEANEHVDIEAFYRLSCDEKNLRLKVKLFGLFEALETIQLRWISSTTQGQDQLTASQPFISVD
ncbi:MAG: DUF2796 domain-containing protein [Pseudomonadota bacterium]